MHLPDATISIRKQRPCHFRAPPLVCCSHETVAAAAAAAAAVQLSCKCLSLWQRRMPARDPHAFVYDVRLARIGSDPRPSIAPSSSARRPAAAAAGKLQARTTSQRLPKRQYRLSSPSAPPRCPLTSLQTSRSNSR